MPTANCGTKLRGSGVSGRLSIAPPLPAKPLDCCEVRGAGRFGPVCHGYCHSLAVVVVANGRLRVGWDTFLLFSL